MNGVADSTGELPPFLFQKRPIKSLPTHLAISDLLPCQKSLSLTHGLSVQGYLSRIPSGLSSPPKQDERLYNNTDYDEQIRAPRMSNITHYAYGKARHDLQESQKVPFSEPKEESFEDSSHSTTTSQQSESSHNTAATSNSCSPKEKEYLPATFDLSQPTRRYSMPVEQDLHSEAILNYTNNNYIYERSSDKLQDEKLLRALENLSSNTTTQEKPRIKNRIIVPSHLDNVKGTDLQQVYEMKKPLCTPAVLRPITSKDTHRITLPVIGLPHSSENASPSPSQSTYLQFPVLATTTTTEDPGNTSSTSQEPTHQHWKPDSSTDHCMKCFVTFGNFFNRKRRHHCRFCGNILCSNCLYRNPELYGANYGVINVDEEEDSLRAIVSNGSIPSANVTDDYVSGVMMDIHARLVIPIFRNLFGDKNSSLKLMKKNFKFCKTCKDCGENYTNVYSTVNNERAPAATPFIFIENPYLKKTPSPVVKPRADVHAPERQSSIGQVPSDWTWSSF